MDKHWYCREQLRIARLRAEDVGVKLPKVSSARMAPDEYWVVVGDYDHESNICCSWNARAEAINYYLDKIVYPVCFYWMRTYWMCNQEQWCSLEEVVVNGGDFDLISIGISEATYRPPKDHKVLNDVPNLRNECAST